MLTESSSSSSSPPYSSSEDSDSDSDSDRLPSASLTSPRATVPRNPSGRLITNPRAVTSETTPRIFTPGRNALYLSVSTNFAPPTDARALAPLAARAIAANGSSSSSSS